MSVTERRENFAIDLLEHPAFTEIMSEIRREATAAKRVILHDTRASLEDTALEIARARGSLAVLRMIVHNLYERANKDMPLEISALFD